MNARVIVDKVNGYMGLLRIVTPIMVGLALFVLTSMRDDVKSIRKDLTGLSANVVYKHDYAVDLKFTRKCMEVLSGRIRDIEKGGG